MNPLISKCPSCGSQNISDIYEVKSVPVHSNLMMSSKNDANHFPVGDILLGFCSDCGFIFNRSFNPAMENYSPIYEDQQSFSPTFNSFSEKLANYLIEKYDLYHKNIVEIGCGKGDFLELLCNLGNNRGTCIDPATRNDRIHNVEKNQILFIQDYYSEKYTDYRGDFILCRHTLEHISPTKQFINTVRKSIGNNLDAPVFFEVPDTNRVIKDLAFWDIYYEHCSYFTPGSLGRLFRSTNFDVTDLFLDFDDQYLLIEAKPTKAPSKIPQNSEESLDELRQNVDYFVQNIDQKLNYWRSFINNLYNQKKSIVIWGSGSKCVAFLTTLNAKDQIDYIVDINPFRHGKFIPGVGKEIKAPEFIQKKKPDTIIIMNPIYTNEIKKMIQDFGVKTTVVSV